MKLLFFLFQMIYLFLEIKYGSLPQKGKKVQRIKDAAIHIKYDIKKRKFIVKRTNNDKTELRMHQHFTLLYMNVIETLEFLDTLFNMSRMFLKHTMSTKAAKMDIYVPAGLKVNVGDAIYITRDERTILSPLNPVGDQNKIYDDTSLKYGKKKLGIEVNKMWYIWKTVTYIGATEGTTGYTKKIYLTDTPHKWTLSFEDDDVTTFMAQALATRGWWLQ